MIQFHQLMEPNHILSQKNGNSNPFILIDPFSNSNP